MVVHDVLSVRDFVLVSPMREFQRCIGPVERGMNTWSKQAIGANSWQVAANSLSWLPC